MFLSGTLVNVVTVLVGTGIGLLLGSQASLKTARTSPDRPPRGSTIGGAA